MLSPLGGMHRPFLSKHVVYIREAKEKRRRENIGRASLSLSLSLSRGKIVKVSGKRHVTAIRATGAAYTSYERDQFVFRVGGGKT